MKHSAEDVPLSMAKARVYKSGHRFERREPIDLRPGPHLFVDDFLIESSANIERVVNVPRRDASVPNPIVTGKEDGCFQPYMTILRDGQTGRFRLWYGHHTEDFNAGRSRLGYLESNDGIHWIRPSRVLDSPVPIQFGVSVIDKGEDFPHPERRYAFGWYMDGGLKVASSPDGFAWTPISAQPVVYHNHDINGIFFDVLRKRYVATVSVYRPGETWSGNRRITMQSHSTDLISWSTPHHVVVPDPTVDDGETQFYAMDGYLRRGDLIIGMVKVLRDDLKADDPPDPPEAYGIGYTTLAWTRDGDTWTRDATPFFSPNPEKGMWDHAHAWIDDQLPVGDEVFLYYGGYARGHKVNRFEERQIGLVRMKKDRYVSRKAGPGIGRILTPLLTLHGGSLTVNADAHGGSLRAQVLDENRHPVPGFTLEDCRPVTTDALAAPITWKRSLGKLRTKPVRLEFVLQNAAIFGFELRNRE
ncbi:MAG: hypothetical protein GWP08_14405 [Nitrospiraceae bacterium]|nr:hypothetical protein [Nitrospiraceae bacterium]